MTVWIDLEGCLRESKQSRMPGESKGYQVQISDFKNGKLSLEGKVVRSRSQILDAAEHKAGQSLGSRDFLGSDTGIPSNRTENPFLSQHHWLICRPRGRVCNEGREVSPKLPEAAGILWQLQMG